MTRWDRNPQRFAIEEMNAAFNDAGRYSHFMSNDEPRLLRIRLGEHAGVRLVSWLRDLEGDVNSLFVDQASGSTIYVREWRCGEAFGCDDVHGMVDVSAPTHDGLVAGVSLVFGDVLGGSSRKV